jgi:hypothetical protein
LNLQLKKARAFIPVTPRETAMVKKCKLTMPYDANEDQDNVGCECTHPNQCHLAKLYEQRNNNVERN